MANIVLITVFLALSYWMATEATYEDMKGQSLCHYNKTENDSKHFGECLTEYGYTVSDPNNCKEVHAANITKDKWMPIMNCTWTKGGLINENGTCNTALQMDIIENKMTFNSTEIKDALVNAIKKCNQNPNCTEALMCGTQASFQICLPNASFDQGETSEE